MESSRKLDFQEMTEHVSTPYFMFDIDSLELRIDQIKRIVEDRCELCYAMKANPFVVKQMSELVGHVEVCSSGELELCISQHVAPETILLSGVYKDSIEIERAIQYGVRTYTIESGSQLKLIQNCSAKHQVEVEIIPRVTSGNQFGLNENELKQIVEDYIINDRYTKLSGIHYFVGTQRNRKNDQREDVSYLLTLLENLERDYGFKPDIIEYGPGLAVPYFVNNDFQNTLQPLEELLLTVQPLFDRYHVRIEMGRFYVAEVGFYVSRVVDVKKNDETRYAIIDGGIHHLNYYGGNMGMRCPVIENLSEYPEMEEEWTLCGSLCTTADILARDLKTHLEIGDLLVFYNAGAYTMTETPVLFLSHDMPTILIVKNGRINVIREPVQTFRVNC